MNTTSPAAPATTERPEDTPRNLRWQWRLMEVAEGGVQVREVFFRADGSVAGWTSAPVVLAGADDAELRYDLTAMAAALELPTLVEVELPGWRPETGSPAEVLANWQAWRNREATCPSCHTPVGEMSARTVSCTTCRYEPEEPPREADGTLKKS